MSVSPPSRNQNKTWIKDCGCHTCEPIEEMNVLWWIVYFTLGLLLIIVISRASEYAATLWYGSSPSTTAMGLHSTTAIVHSTTVVVPKTVLNPFLCICLDVLVYFLWGLVIWSERFTVWSVILYILVFELFTQTIMAYYWPQYFFSTTTKSITEVVSCISAFVIGRWLQARARKQGSSSSLSSCGRCSPFRKNESTE